MGKIRRQRQKYHLSTDSKQSVCNDNEIYGSELPMIPLNGSRENIFAGLEISYNDLNKSLNDDTKSVKSFKSFKSEISKGKQLKKKDKIALRREFILNKINVVEQARKSVAAKKKREKTIITGDLKSLHDALPSLESLIHSNGSQNAKSAAQTRNKKKPIEKKRIREKTVIRNVKMLKEIITNKEFKKNPLKLMTDIINTNILKQT